MTPKMKRTVYIGLLLAVMLLCLLGLWHLQTSGPPTMPKHFFSAKIVKVLYHDTLYAALRWPSGKINRLWREYDLAQCDDDWSYCCDMDSALQWASAHGIRHFEQPNDNGTVDYFHIVYPGMPFEVITPWTAGKYEPRVMGWVHISADTGGHWDAERNLILSTVCYCMSADQDSATLSDIAIYRRLHHLPSPIIY